MKRDRYVSIFAAIILFSVSQVTSANIITFISKVSSDGGDGVEYSYTLSAWTSESDNIPSPCAGWSSCYVFMGHRHYKDGTSGDTMDESFDDYDITHLKTIGDIRKKILKAGVIPHSGKVSHYDDDHQHITNECVGIFYSKNDPEDEGNSVDHSKLLPTSICGVAPPPTGVCQFNTNAVVIDYGSTSAKAIDGKKLSMTVDVKCSVKSNVGLYLLSLNDGTNEVKLRSDGSISSKLTINGKDASTSGLEISVPSATNVPITITSEIITSGNPKAGVFSGSAVLILTIQ